MKFELSIEDQKRFWSNVVKMYLEDGTESCWLWHGYINTNGYGVFMSGFAHRISWFLDGKTISLDNVLDHKCRTRNCINPEHLRAITRAENTRLRIMYEGQKIDEDLIIQKKPLTQLQKCVNHLKEVFLAVAYTKYGSGDNSEKVLHDMIRLKLQEPSSMFSKEKDLEQLIGGYKRKYFWYFDEILAEHNLHNRYSIIRKKLEDNLSID